MNYCDAVVLSKHDLSHVSALDPVVGATLFLATAVGMVLAWPRTLTAAPTNTMGSGAPRPADPRGAAVCRATAIFCSGKR